MQPTTLDCDVLVAGGGTAGVVAAIQASRAGSRTILLEMTGQLGGTTTTGGVSAPAHFWTRHRQVISGIGWELVSKTLALDGSSPPDFLNPPPHRPQWQVRINPFIHVLVCEDEALRAGVDLHYHVVAAAIGREADTWVVDSVGKNWRSRIRAKEVIDCTGDADLVGMLGLPRERGDVRQPGTLTFRLGGYDAASLDAQLVQARYQQAMACGELKPGDFHEPAGDFNKFLRLRGGNQLHVFDADSTSARTQTRANIDGRAGLLRVLRFIKTLPGCEGVKVESMCGATAVRETCRIVGRTTVTEADYMSGRRFDDAVCYSFYFIDLHTEQGGERVFLADGIEPTIPLGALAPQGAAHLLVAGRTLSSDRRANSALRVQASCMAMGQAAGAAAALGVRLGVPSCDVPLDLLRDLLREHGAIVP
jgi:glycine/D-amino acid oxidase-like deaminating enzyme